MKSFYELWMTVSPPNQDPPLVDRDLGQAWKYFHINVLSRLNELICFLRRRREKNIIHSGSQAGEMYKPDMQKIKKELLMGGKAC